MQGNRQQMERGGGSFRGSSGTRPMLLTMRLSAMRVAVLACEVNASLVIGVTMSR